MKARIRKKSQKSPSKKKLARMLTQQIAKQQADHTSAMIVKHAEFNVLQQWQDQNKAELEKWKETAGRAIAVFKDFAPDIYTFAMDKRRPKLVPDYAIRGQFQTQSPPPRNETSKLYDLSTFPDHVKTCSEVTRFVHALEFYMTQEPQSNAQAFTFMARDLSGRSPAGTSIGTRHYITHEILLRSPDNVLRYIFQDMCETMWKDFRKYMDENKGARA